MMTDSTTSDKTPPKNARFGTFIKLFLNLNHCRSEIHGRGLFCKRNIEAGEMVIEYAGTVIRAVLTDKREKYYDSKVSERSAFVRKRISATRRRLR